MRLTESQTNELQAAFLHCPDALAKTRHQAVRRYATGYPVAQITDICGCSTRTLLNWTRTDRERGLTALLDHRQGGNRARLKPEQIETVQNQLHGYTPAGLLGRDPCVGDGQFWTAADLACLLKRDYGVVYQSHTSYLTLLQKCGFSYQRPAKQDKSHSEAKIMDFEEQLDKKLVDLAQEAPNTVILAADEASLYLQASLMRVWAPLGQSPIVKACCQSLCKRDHTHFYGALNLATGQEVVMRSDLMTGQVSALFLNRLLGAYPDKPILLLWDRAPWHKGEAIRCVLAANPRLEVMWFSPGCPELNPQEHVWKAAREAVSHNHLFAKLPTLATAFETHLEQTPFPCSLLDKHGYQVSSRSDLD